MGATECEEGVWQESMNANKKRVEVVIDGQVIAFVSNENDEAYMQKIALFINKKLDELKPSKSSAPLGEPLRSFRIYANLADDYFKAVAKQEEMEAAHSSHAQDMERVQEENRVLAENIQEMQDQLQLAREKYVRDIEKMQGENILLAERGQMIQEQLNQAMAQHEQELKQLNENNTLLAEAKRDLQEQLQHARAELESYIANYDEMHSGQKVLNFNNGNNFNQGNSR